MLITIAAGSTREPLVEDMAVRRANPGPPLDRGVARVGQQQHPLGRMTRQQQGQRGRLKAHGARR